MERAHLTALQREQRNRVAIVANELYFKGRTAAMHQDGSAHVAVQQSVFGQVARQGYRVQFIDGCHNFGNGWALTSRGEPPPGSIYHALRRFKRVPSGADALAFVVLGVTKRPASGIKSGHEHWIQTGPF